MPLALSVHETVPVWAGRTVEQSLADTLAFARGAEALGIRRFWVAEHHGIAALASSSPAVLVSSILAHTTTLRVGSGAVLLPYHSPLVVAEQFAVLAALHPGRVDLGLGRGAGGASAAVSLLPPARPAPPGEQVAAVRELFDDAASPLSPRPASAPQIWILGSSSASARSAGEAGLPFAYAELIAPGGAAAALDAYRASFRASSALRAPHAALAVNAVVAADAETAWARASAFLVGQASIARDPGALPPYVDDARRALSALPPEQQAIARHKGASMIVGGPDDVHARIAPLVAASRPDELFALTQVPFVPHRLESYERLLGVLERIDG